MPLVGINHHGRIPALADNVGAFSRLGPINKRLQTFISDYYEWKKRARRQTPHAPTFFELTSIKPLAVAEDAFYEVGVTVEEARKVLAAQFANLRELARYVAARAASVVLEDEGVLTDAAFVSGVDLEQLRFDPDEMRARYEACAGTAGRYEWSFDPSVMRCFRTEPRADSAVGPHVGAEDFTLFTARGGQAAAGNLGGEAGD